MPTLGKLKFILMVPLLFFLLSSAAGENGSNIGSNHSQAVSRDGIGDRLPVTVDPESPGSCSGVATDEFCRDCCRDSFKENSESLKSCVNACAKAEASRHEF